MNQLIRTHLNCEIPHILAHYRDKKLIVKVNPAAGYLMYVVFQDGKQQVETLSLDSAINIYNDLKEVV
jgi:hypothetical protein